MTVTIYSKTGELLKKYVDVKNLDTDSSEDYITFDLDTTEKNSVRTNCEYIVEGNIYNEEE